MTRTFSNTLSCSRVYDGNTRCSTRLLDYELSVFFLKSSARGTQLTTQIRERNEEGIGRGRKKTDYGSFFVVQIPVPENWKYRLDNYLSIC